MTDLCPKWHHCEGPSALVAAVAAAVEQEALTHTLWLSSLKLAMLPVQEKPLNATTRMDLDKLRLVE